MVIREIVDALDREIQSHRSAIRRIQKVKDRVLACCREQPQILRISAENDKCPGGKLKKVA